MPRREQSRLYKTAAWKRLRLAILADQPTCQMCETNGRTTAATVVDHITPHEGDESLFWDTGNLQSLCAHHHNRDKQREEADRRALRAKGIQIQADGWMAKA